MAKRKPTPEERALREKRRRLLDEPLERVWAELEARAQARKARERDLGERR